MEKGMISVDALYENIQCLLPICNAMEKMLAENPLDSLRATENQREKRGMAATPFTQPTVSNGTQEPVTVAKRAIDLCRLEKGSCSLCMA